MLKILFNRNSYLPKVLEILGLAGSFYLVLSGWIFKQSLVLKIFFIVYALFYVLVRACQLKNWYKGMSTDPDIGIRLHFRKMVVAASYVTFFVSLLAVAGAGFAVYLGAAFLIFIFHINAILLYFHFKDKDTTPPNFYTKGLSS